MKIPIQNYLSKNNKNKKINTKNINTHTTLVAVLTLVSRLLGFIRIGIISSLYGASSSADVLNLVLSIPNNLRKLLAEGALYNAYMPSYANAVALSKKATQESIRFFFELLFWISIVTLIIVVILSHYSSSITKMLFDLEITEQQNLATHLFSKSIFFLWFVTLAAVYSGILQTHKNFVIPALTPIIMSVTTIFSIVILSSKYTIFSVVYGYLVGSFFQVIILLLSTIMLGYHLFSKELFNTLFRKPLVSVELKNTLKRFPIISLAVILPIVGQQIAFYFASTLPIGSSSAFSYAIVFWQLPIGVVINSVVNVTYAYLLTLVQKNNSKNIVRCIINAIETLCLFIIPLTIMFIFFAHAGISVAIQRANLTSEATKLTSQILQAYSLGLLPMGFYLLFQKIFYVLQKNISVFIYSFLFTIIDILLTYILIQTKLQVIGISLAYTLTLIIIVPIMYLNITRHINIYFPVKKILIIMSGVFPLFVISWIISHFTKQYWYQGSNLGNIFRFSVITLVILTILLLGYRTVGIHLLHTFKKIKKEPL